MTKMIIMPKPEGSTTEEITSLKLPELGHVSNIPSKWYLLTKDSAQFIFSQAQLRLKETIDAYVMIRDVAHKVITIIIPIITASIAFIFLKKTTTLEITLPVVVFICCYLFAAAVLLISIRHKPVHMAGSYPGDLLNDTMIITKEEGFSEDEQYINYISCVCGHIQDSINANTQRCNQIASLNVCAIFIAIIIASSFLFITWALVEKLA